VSIVTNPLAPTNRDDGYFTDTLAADVSGFTAAIASYDLMNWDTATYAARRQIQIKMLESQSANDEKLSPEQLNKEYPGMNFTEGKSRLVATELANRNAKYQELQVARSLGPQGLKGTILDFGMGAVASMTDPLEIGAGIATGFGIGFLAKTAIGKAVAKTAVARTVFGAGRLTAAEAARSVELGISQGLARKTIAQEVAKDAAEGFIGNIATEMSLVASAAQAEGREYTAGDVLYNSAIGALAFAGVKGVGGRTLNWYRGIGDQHFKIVDDSTTGQQFMDKAPTAQHVHEAGVKMTDIPHDQTGYHFAPITDPSVEAPTKQLYVPIANSSSDISGVSAKVYDYRGPGVEISDNPAVTNAGAVRANGDGSMGSHVEVKVKEGLDIENLNAPITPEHRMTPILQQVADDMGVKFEMPETPKSIDKTINDFLELTGVDEQDFLDAVAAKAKEQGIKGYSFIVDKVAGVDHSPHNGLVIFDHADLEVIKQHEVNPELVRNPTPDELAKIKAEQESPASDLDHNPDAAKAVADNLENPQIPEVRGQELAREADQAVADLKQAHDAGLLDEISAKEAKDIIDYNEKADAFLELSKAVEKCWSGN